MYELPFCTLYSNDIDNLICAGRCISATDDMWDITRVIPFCAVSIEDVGTAITDNFADTDIKKASKILVSNGVVLHE